MVVMDWEERKESQVIKVMNDIFFFKWPLSLNKKGCKQSQKAKTFAGQAAVCVNLDTLFVHFSCIWTLNWKSLTSRLCQQQRNHGTAALALRKDKRGSREQWESLENEDRVGNRVIQGPEAQMDLQESQESQGNVQEVVCIVFELQFKQTQQQQCVAAELRNAALGLNAT